MKSQNKILLKNINRIPSFYHKKISKKNRINKTPALAILLFVISLTILLLASHINSSIILEKRALITTLSIGEIAGFDVNKTALTFGTITHNSNSQRNLIVKNNYPFPIKLELNTEGDIEKLLIFDKVIYLDVGEEKIININTP